MSARIAKVVRVYRNGEQPPKQLHYWRQRPPSERLVETLALHAEGNVLFKGGNPSFEFVMKVRRAAPRG